MRARISSVFMAAALLLPISCKAGSTHLAGTPLQTSPCLPCSMVTTRAPAVSERSLEERFVGLGDPENPRESKGPNGVRAVMKPDARLHPHIFLIDSTGASHPLLAEKLATNPRFSPDGKKIACSAFESSSRPWILTIVDVSTGKAISPMVGSLASKFKWSPDSRWVAVEGTVLDTSLRAFSIVNAATGQLALQDTTGVVANYEFAWSPDSRMLAVTRPTETDDHEELVRSELWVFGLTKTKCRFPVDSNGVVSAPAWIDNHLIRIEQGGSKSTAAGSPTVLEISCPKSP
jgi:hypothetical protein